MGTPGWLPWAGSSGDSAEELPLTVWLVAAGVGADRRPHPADSNGSPGSAELPGRALAQNNLPRRSLALVTQHQHVVARSVQDLRDDVARGPGPYSPKTRSSGPSPSTFAPVVVATSSRICAQARVGGIYLQAMAIPIHRGREGRHRSAATWEVRVRGAASAGRRSATACSRAAFSCARASLRCALGSGEGTPAAIPAVFGRRRLTANPSIRLPQTTTLRERNIASKAAENRARWIHRAS